MQFGGFTLINRRGLGRSEDWLAMFIWWRLFLVFLLFLWLLVLRFLHGTSYPCLALHHQCSSVTQSDLPLLIRPNVLQKSLLSGCHCKLVSPKSVSRLFCLLNTRPKCLKDTEHFLQPVTLNTAFSNFLASAPAKNASFHTNYRHAHNKQS